MIDDLTAKILREVSLMVKTEGWQFMKRDFENKIAVLQAEINKIGGNEMKYSENDMLKIELSCLKDILDYPEKYMALTQKETKPEEEDPYNPANQN